MGDSPSPQPPTLLARGPRLRSSLSGRSGAMSTSIWATWPCFRSVEQPGRHLLGVEQPGLSKVVDVLKSGCRARPRHLVGSKPCPSFYRLQIHWQECSTKRFFCRETFSILALGSQVPLWFELADLQLVISEKAYCSCWEVKMLLK